MNNVFFALALCSLLAVPSCSADAGPAGPVGPGGPAGEPGPAGACAGCTDASTPGATVTTVDQLVAGINLGVTSLWLSGYHTPADGGGGLFVAIGAECTVDGGTFVKDAGGTCFHRATTNYGPREFGAHGDGAQDDTVYLQAWLDAAQPHVGDVGAYVTTAELVCHTGTVLQGPGVEYSAAGDFAPPFRILADKARWNPASTTMLRAKSFCRIAGAAFLAHPAIDTVLVDGHHVSIDSRSALVGGRNNVVDNDEDNDDTEQGLQIKDSTILKAAEYGLKLGCVNVRVIGNIISGAGQSAIHYSGIEITIANNMLEEAEGDGVWLDGATSVKLIGNQLNKNGKGPGGGHALRIRDSKDVAVTGNQFNKTDFGSAVGTGGAHVLLEGSGANDTGDISFSGNVYTPFDDGAGSLPDYAYDVTGTLESFGRITLYERPIKQGVDVYSPAADALFTALGDVVH